MKLQAASRVPAHGYTLRVRVLRSEVFLFKGTFAGLSRRWLQITFNYKEADLEISGATVQSGVPSKPVTVRQLWLRLFIGFMVFQTLIVAFGIFMASGGASLGEVATQKLTAIRPMFQSISAVGVVACMVIARAKLHPDSLKSVDELFRFTTLCLIVGEITVLLSAVGLAKMFIGQFLVAAVLVYFVNFAIVLPSGLRLLAQPIEKIENPRNKFEL